MFFREDPRPSVSIRRPEPIGGFCFDRRITLVPPWSGEIRLSTSTLTKLAPTQVELVIPISAEEMQQAEDRAFRRLVKKAKLPGFRPGKVPRRVFEQAYGTEAITNEAMEDVVPTVYAKAVREHDLEPVDRPKMELLPEDDGQPRRIKAVVDVRPEIALGEYKALPVAAEPVTVQDEDVDRALKTLARDRATLVPVEREARLGDVVTIDYEGRIDGVAFEGGSAKGQQTELSGERFIPGFATGIAGMTAGETKDVEAAFPQDYQQTDLAGKAAVFTITLHEVKELELPALDDELAKAVSQHQTLDDLKVDIRKRLQAAAEARIKRETGNTLVERLVAAHDFPLPNVLVEREIDGMVTDGASMAARMGMSFDDYLTTVGKTEADLRKEYRASAEQRVKGTLILETIAKTENIRATPADIQSELESLARQYGQPVDRIRQALGNNLLSLMDGIVRNKTVEFLVEHANIERATPADKS
ncbi:MAG TPA: trigger factor [Candidatus Baltobacteraceae bacterium]|nr:trigger factor [Candidatus Baltobacteraceae bacterium]